MSKLTENRFTIFLLLWIIQPCFNHDLDLTTIHDVESRKNEKGRYPNCMADDNGLTLWCDHSKYESLPDTVLSDNRSAISPEIASIAKFFYVNDSLIQNLKEGDLASFRSMTIFVAENNFLTVIESKVFYGNSKLEVIDLSRNCIREIQMNAFQGQGGLLELDISSNEIPLIRDKTFISLRNLTKLNLRNNQIGVIQKDGFRRLKSLETLDLSENKIHSFYEGTFRYLKQLRFLYLRNNFLVKIPDFTAPMVTLQSLDLGINHLEELGSESFNLLSGLRELYLDQNSLHNITESAFYATENLEILNMSSNHLQKIPNSAFMENRNLRVLSIAFNDLRYLKISWFEYLKTNMEPTVNLQGNDWWCKCPGIAEVKDLIVALKPHNPPLSESLNIKCSNPKSNKGLLSETEFICSELSPHALLDADSDSNKPSPVKKFEVKTTASAKTIRAPSTAVGSMVATEDTSRLIMRDKTEAQLSSSFGSTKIMTLSIMPAFLKRSTVIIPKILNSHNGIDAQNRNEEAHSLKRDGGDSHENSLYLIAFLVMGLIIIILVFFVYRRKGKKNPCKGVKRKLSRRRRMNSSQPFLDDPSTQDVELTEPFSTSDEDNEEVLSFQRNYNSTSATTPTSTEPEDIFYTPQVTPREVPKRH